jgi:DnaJ like chaperone protein
MRQFRSVCFGRFDLIRMFLEIQIQAAFADGRYILTNVKCCM